MKRFVGNTAVFLLVLSICCIHASDWDEFDYADGDPDLADYLKEAIENFRNQMTKGIPEIKMPVLDPLELRNLDINVNENVATVELHISEFYLHGLSSFILHYISPNLEELFLQMNFTFPVLTANGRYNLDGRIYKIFPVMGNGHFKVNATSVYVGGTGKLGFAGDLIQMEVLDLDFAWEKAEIDFENFIGNGSFSEVMQRIITGVGRDVYMRYKPLILNPLSEALRRKVNEELQKPAVKDIIKGILPMK